MITSSGVRRGARVFDTAIRSVTSITARQAVVAAFLLLTTACGQPAPAAPPPTVIDDVRGAVAREDFAAAEKIVAADRAAHGVTPIGIEAQATLARTALTANQLEVADRNAQAALDAGTAARPPAHLDDEPHLALAMGTAIETMAQLTTARGAREEALSFLTEQFAAYGQTSIGKKIQKNVNLLTLEGQPAPALDISESLGAPSPQLDSLRGRVVLLFFWAHWCPDCKAQGPILDSLVAKYAGLGLSVVAPTQRYGYVAGGKPAGPDEERDYIDTIRHRYYQWLETQPVPLATENHLRYGVSSTPTIVLVDRTGTIRMYHPGRIAADDLDARIRTLLAS